MYFFCPHYVGRGKKYIYKKRRLEEKERGRKQTKRKRKKEKETCALYLQ